MENEKLLDEMIWACAKGEITVPDAAKKCELSYQQFYKRLRHNAEAYMLFREKVSRRKAPLVADTSRRMYEGARDHDLEYERRLASIMARYRAKSGLALKERLARAMGLTYGYYVAFTDGYCRL